MLQESQRFRKLFIIDLSFDRYSIDVLVHVSNSASVIQDFVFCGNVLVLLIAPQHPCCKSLRGLA